MPFGILFNIWCGFKFIFGLNEDLVHSPNANSEERSQTQIKGSAFGFLEDGRELNYNPHLTNRKK